MSGKNPFLGLGFGNPFITFARLVSGGASVISDGLVMHLDAGDTNSYSGSGTTWTDLSGNGNNGTLQSMSGANYSSANGGYLDFDGASDYVTLPFNTEYTNISIDVWATRDQLNVYNSIMGKYGSSAGYELIFNNSGGVRFHTSNQSIDSTTSLSADVWYHIVGTYDGSTARIYINGSLDASGSTSRNTNTVNWRIGRSAWGGNYHNGKISNIRLYNKALTASEVLQNYDALKGRYS